MLVAGAQQGGGASIAGLRRAFDRFQGLVIGVGIVTNSIPLGSLYYYTSTTPKPYSPKPYSDYSGPYKGLGSACPANASKLDFGPGQLHRRAKVSHRLDPQDRERGIREIREMREIREKREKREIRDKR